MPVLMVGDVPGLTEEAYGGMVGQLMPLLKAAKGFIAHAGGPGPDGAWRVVEIWDTEEDGQRWFEEHVRPNLPGGADATRTYSPLHTAFTA